MKLRSRAVAAALLLLTLLLPLRHAWAAPDKGATDEERLLSLLPISEPTRLLSNSYAVFCLKKKSHLRIRAW